MTGTFNLFTYGTLRRDGVAARLLRDCEPLGEAWLPGILYDIDGEYPALLMYGDAPVNGECWRCPASLLGQLDGYEQVDAGLFRRVGVEMNAADGSTLPGWTYVAGPALSRKLTPDARVAGGRWR